MFRTISPNVESEESGMRDDSGMQDVAYTEVDIPTRAFLILCYSSLRMLYYQCCLGIICNSSDHCY